MEDRSYLSRDETKEAIGTYHRACFGSFLIQSLLIGVCVLIYLYVISDVSILLLGGAALLSTGYTVILIVQNGKQEGPPEAVFVLLFIIGSVLCFWFFDQGGVWWHRLLKFLPVFLLFLIRNNELYKHLTLAYYQMITLQIYDVASQKRARYQSAASEINELNDQTLALQQSRLKRKWDIRKAARKNKKFTLSRSMDCVDRIPDFIQYENVALHYGGRDHVDIFKDHCTRYIRKILKEYSNEKDQKRRDKIRNGELAAVNKAKYLVGLSEEEEIRGMSEEAEKLVEEARRERAKKVDSVIVSPKGRSRRL